MASYYNENDPFAAAWLTELIKAGEIVDGEVDSRSISEVRKEDLHGFRQCHFFAGIGGWSRALRLAGFPDDRPVWTGSCPCQSFSTAGAGKGRQDERHLWPTWRNLIRECKPPIIFGEQVASAITFGWWDEVAHDLENEAYACAAAVLPACSVGAPHRRDRLWFVAHSEGERKRGEQRYIYETNGRSLGQSLQQPDGASKRTCLMADSQSIGQQQICAHISGGEKRNRTAGQERSRPAEYRSGSRVVANADSDNGHWWSGPLQVGWNCIQGKITRGGREYDAQWLTKPGLGLLAHGIPNRVGKLRGYGNAIVPQVAAEFIKSAM